MIRNKPQKSLRLCVCGWVRVHVHVCTFVCMHVRGRNRECVCFPFSFGGVRGGLHQTAETKFDGGRGGGEEIT